MGSKGIENEMVKGYNEPYHMWPIETFPAGKQYINLIQELLDSYRIPEIKQEYRPLTSKEILNKRVMIKSYSELRENLFKDVDDAFAETTFRCIYSRELSRGYVWDISDITARDMTPKEKINHDKIKQRIFDKKAKYHNDKLDKFEENYRKMITEY